MNEQTGSVAISGGKKRAAAGIFAIVFGALGIHKFYLGYALEGTIILVLLLISQGVLSPFLFILGAVEGILYLTKTDEEFRSTYLTAKKAWF